MLCIVGGTLTLREAARSVGVPADAIEAQSQFVVEIEARVFTYYARIWLELRLPIVSIVVYADKNPHWRPERYVQELPGTRLDFQFHVGAYAARGTGTTG